ncbi:tRNA adenosine(34) deaminase TadA [Geomobilimonas luticola]|uniref:tRNA-specific adenosine deaminase n=1 Tax=Geomobilimonas luticola TaxID=1114878 RepID=A0ABS5S996_9BACT|nr:tRNA adenosine(34) deaminase TadA [Geomobilimonas luticola]MBT0651941.1 tRNA adenosine(34) deaminase TadA [Geomobilimonas luticola]
MKDDVYWMGIALREANKAADLGEVPIGAVVVRDGSVLGRGHNLRESRHDPTAHAEMIAIRQAARRSDNWRLSGATLYVTVEPCVMCMGGILLARIDRVVFGCHDPKAGAAGSLYDLSADSRLNHRVTLTAGVRGAECAATISSFFASLRKRKRQQKDTID